MHTRSDGFTLVEMLLAMALVAASLLFIVGMIPSGVLSLKKAEDLQAATAYGLEVVNATRDGLLPCEGDWSTRLTLNDTPFEVRRDTSPVPGTDGRLLDVIVTVSWPRQTRPVTLATRVDPSQTGRMRQQAGGTP